MHIERIDVTKTSQWIMAMVLELSIRLGICAGLRKVFKQHFFQVAHWLSKTLRFCPRKTPWWLTIEIRPNANFWNTMIGKFRSGEGSVQGIPISLFFFGIYNLHGICQSTRKNHAKVEIHDFHRTQGKCIKKEKLGGIFDGKQPAHNCKVCIFISAYLIFFLLMSFNLTSFS